MTLKNTIPPDSNRKADAAQTSARPRKRPSDPERSARDDSPGPVKRRKGTSGPELPPQINTPAAISPVPAFRPKPIRILDATTRNLDLIRVMWTASMGFFGSAFSARRTLLDTEGFVVDLGPDYAVRISALFGLIEVCTRGRKPVSQEAAQNRHMCTWPELDAVVKELKRRESLELDPGQSDCREPDSAASETLEPIATQLASGCICDLTNAHGEEIEMLVELGLRSLAGVFEARRMRLSRDGDLVDVGPNYAVGFAAQRMLVALATRGRKSLPVPAGSHKRSLEELIEDSKYWGPDKPDAPA